MKQQPGIVATKSITTIRQSLKHKYEQDQRIQRVIEEIGAEEGLTQSELTVVYEAYMEVKERLFYTAVLHNLWNQIDDVQNRLNLLHVYNALEEDLSDAGIENTIIEEHMMHTVPDDTAVIGPVGESNETEDQQELDSTDEIGNERTEVQNITLKPIDLTNVKVPDIVMELLNSVYFYVDRIQEETNPSKKEQKKAFKAEVKRNKKTLKELKKLAKKEGKKLEKLVKEATKQSDDEQVPVVDDNKADTIQTVVEKTEKLEKPEKSERIDKTEKSDKKKKSKKICTKCKKCKGKKCKNFKG